LINADWKNETNCIWITIQAHKNSIAVALIKDIKSIIFTNNVTLDKEVIKKAKEEKINLLRTDKNSFTVCMMEAETGKD